MGTGEFLPYIGYALLISAFLLNLYVLRMLGDKVMKIVFISFSFGTLFLGLSQLFIALTDLGFYSFENVTFHIWWHLLFYLSLASFFWAGYRMKKLSKEMRFGNFEKQDKIVFGFLTAVGFLVFFVSAPLEKTLAASLTGSFVDKFGLHHFLAFFFALMTAVYINFIKKSWGNVLSVTVNPILLFLLFMGGQHFWELVTESLKIISLPESAIEQVELLFVIPAYLFLNFAFLKAGKTLSKMYKGE